MWGAYRGLAAQGFQHSIVNHTFNFVDPATGVTTDSRSNVATKQIKIQRYVWAHISYHDTRLFLSEFMWAQRFKEHSYFHFWDQVVHNYVV